MVWFLKVPQRFGPDIKKFCVPDRCVRDTDCVPMKEKKYGVYHSTGCKPLPNDFNHGKCVYQKHYLKRPNHNKPMPRARPNYGS